MILTADYTSSVNVIRLTCYGRILIELMTDRLDALPTQSDAQEHNIYLPLVHIE